MYIIIIVLLIIMVVLLFGILYDSNTQIKRLNEIDQKIESIKNGLENSLREISTDTRSLYKLENITSGNEKRQIIELLEKIESNTCEGLEDDMDYLTSGNAKEHIIKLLEKIESNTCEDNTNL